MASTLDWKSSEDPRDIVHIAVQALVEGRLVAFPAETAYHVFASGLKPDAVSSLTALAAEHRTRTPCIFLRSPQEALDYSPTLSRVASRLVHRGWPGPLVLELPADGEGSLVGNLPAAVRQQLLVEGRYLPQRVAAHEAIVQAMRLLPGPLVAASMIDPQGQAICCGREAASAAGAAVVAVVDDGRTHYGGFASSVRVDGRLCQVTAPGVVDQEALHRLSQLIVLLVCTGNTCRSPMAETILRDMLTRRYPQLFNGQMPPASILSAGLSAFPGGPASPEAVSVLKKRGLNLSAHQSRSLTERSLKHADLILTMTQSHRTAIVERMPQLSGRVHLLSGGKNDVADPFGGPEAGYAACADQIEGYLQGWLDQMEESWFPQWQNAVD
ncbi:MAG: Sua5/YciO/YrdC/YwlC family protein [Planctomycetales bacterium]|nr:Sua5/YciO/YrdC/YwlC family protein [Planctomycetales bacterium]